MVGGLSCPGVFKFDRANRQAIQENNEVDRVGGFGGGEVDLAANGKDVLLEAGLEVRV